MASAVVTATVESRRSSELGDRRSLVALSVRAAFTLSGLGIGVVLTRLLDEGEVGVWFSLISTSVLGTAVLGQGLPFAVSRSVATDHEHGRSVIARACVRTLGPWFALSVALVAVATAEGKGELSRSLIVGAAVAAVMVGPQLLERLMSEAGRGAEVDWIGMLGDGVLSRTLFTVVAAILLVAGLGAGLVELLVIFEVSVLVFVALAAAAISRALPATSATDRRSTSVFTTSLWLHAGTTAFIAQGDLSSSPPSS